MELLIQSLLIRQGKRDKLSPERLIQVQMDQCSDVIVHLCLTGQAEACWTYLLHDVGHAVVKVLLREDGLAVIVLVLSSVVLDKELF